MLWDRFNCSVAMEIIIFLLCMSIYSFYIQCMYVLPVFDVGFCGHIKLSGTKKKKITCLVLSECTVEAVGQ